MLSLDNLRSILRQEYPDATDDQIEQAAREALDQLQNAASEIDSEDIAQQIADASPQEDMDRFEKVGIYGVVIMSQRDKYVCRPCLDHDGEMYTIRERRDNPPLPHDECENEECRCTMLPIPDRETYIDMLGDEPDLSNLPQYSND